MSTWPRFNVAVRLLLAAGALLLLASCSSVAPVVKVGLVAPFEGRERAVGYDAIYAARLAVRELNEAGGVGGYRVALVALDDGGQTDLAQQTAASLAIDPGVVAVVGHFLPATTSAALPVYAESGLATLAIGPEPFAPADPTSLSPDFIAAYEAVTPFDEQAGPYAGPTYAAFQQIWAALAEAERAAGVIDRNTVRDALLALE